MGFIEISELAGDCRLLMVPQNLSQRLAHFQATVVVNVSLFPEAVHEQIDSWTRGSDHFRQDLVTQDRNLDDRWAFLIQVR